MMVMENYFLFPYLQFSLDWDPHTFGVGDLHEQLMPLAMDSPVSSQAPTGYLQDAVAQWSHQCKRRLLASSPVHDSTTTTATEELQDLLEVGFWDSNCYGEPLHNLNYMLQDNAIIPDEPLNMLLKDKTQVTASEQPPQETLSSSSSYEEPQHFKEQHDEKDPYRSTDTTPALPTSKVKALAFKECERRQFKRNNQAKMSVVYPFAVVKPGGVEGDVTLDDINARILTRPRRPVRHPVGEYAHGPCVSPDGRGLSGKAVVSLTRIKTQGRGTITIIRTKG